MALVSTKITKFVLGDTVYFNMVAQINYMNLQGKQSL